MRRCRIGSVVSPAPLAHLPPVAIRTLEHRAAPEGFEPLQLGRLIDEAGCQQHPPRSNGSGGMGLGSNGASSWFGTGGKARATTGGGVENAAKSGGLRSMPDSELGGGVSASSTSLAARASATKSAGCAPET